MDQRDIKQADNRIEAMAMSQQGYAEPRPRPRVPRPVRLLFDDPSDPRHGTVTGYVHGCRCDRCREASSAYFKERRKTGRFDLHRRRRMGDADWPLGPREAGHAAWLARAGVDPARIAEAYGTTDEDVAHAASTIGGRHG